MWFSWYRVGSTTRPQTRHISGVQVLKSLKTREQNAEIITVCFCDAADWKHKKLKLKGFFFSVCEDRRGVSGRNVNSKTNGRGFWSRTVWRQCFCADVYQLAGRETEKNTCKYKSWLISPPRDSQPNQTVWRKRLTSNITDYKLIKTLSTFCLSGEVVDISLQRVVTIRSCCFYKTVYFCDWFNLFCSLLILLFLFYLPCLEENKLFYCNYLSRVFEVCVVKSELNIYFFFKALYWY